MFPFWLESCKQNSTIDFLIATDQTMQSPAPNIKVFQTTLKEIKDRIEGIVGFSVWLEKPYKLCDFRPLYEQIFAEYTDGYDFWGYCDCDLVFGDIRSFITEDLLETKDYILGMGHFHFQRTHDEKYEEVWKTARGLWRDIHWKEVFKSSKNEWFDELPYGVSGRYYDMYPEKMWSGFSPLGKCYGGPSSSYFPFIDVYLRYDLYSKEPGYQNHLERLPFWRREHTEEMKDVIYLKEGINLYAVGVNSKGSIIKKPVLYAHFIKRKFSIKTDNTENYMIYPDVFSPPPFMLSKLTIKWYANNPIGWLKRKWQNLLQRLKRRINGR